MSILRNKFIAVVILLTFSALPAIALPITVEGQGVSPQAATREALRIAIERQVGVLVDAETQVVNYIALSDRITTTTRGFIKTYRTLSISGPDEAGLYLATLEADVDLTRLKDTLDAMPRKKIDGRLVLDAQMERMSVHEAKQMAEVLIRRFAKEYFFELPPVEGYIDDAHPDKVTLLFREPINGRISEIWKEDFARFLAVSGRKVELHQSALSPEMSDPSESWVVGPVPAPNEVFVTHCWFGKWEGYWLNRSVAKHLKESFASITFGFRLSDAQGKQVALVRPGKLGDAHQLHQSQYTGKLYLNDWVQINFRPTKYVVSEEVLDKSQVMDLIFIY